MDGLVIVFVDKVGFIVCIFVGRFVGWDDFNEVCESDVIEFCNKDLEKYCIVINECGENLWMLFLVKVVFFCRFWREFFDLENNVIGCVDEIECREERKCIWFLVVERFFSWCCCCFCEWFFEEIFDVVIVDDVVLVENRVK